MTAHPIHRRYHAEDLVRLRRADERRRYLASQRCGRVDPNPHQIDAVIFALQRIGQGGCILADEVGLGKTIEAGLTMAQVLAEGAQRMLLITPKPLLGQWQEEMLTLFGLDVREGTADKGGLEGAGLFAIGREYAGSEAGSEAIERSGAFDLCVIDEAHEIFAGIYKRYDRHGQVRSGARYAQLAARVKRALGDTPVLLLTATPIQNTLTELWGLVQYVEPTGMLLGDLPTFRTLFCDGDDRHLRPGQDGELRDRIATVCQRTLRRQAQEFMERKFTRRTARLFEYSMSAPEAALYDDVTEYLLDPTTAAFSGGHRRLLLISFHRRMASSVAALTASLDSVANRLEKRLKGPDGSTLGLFVDAMIDDLEEEAVSEHDLPQDAPLGAHSSEEPSPQPLDEELARQLEDHSADDPLRLEFERVRALADRARTLPGDAKAEQLVEAVRYVLARGATGEGSGKVVVLTEALSTQDYLRDLLVDRGVLSLEDITLFRGQNTGARPSEALARWEREVGAKLLRSGSPSRGVATRMALVHEFATRSKIFISTEAGAKGLNLQFCESLINYDLPWNPQRIEQRIGRCHRYGQTRDVTVINFLCRDNEAQRLTFEILSRKLDLFGTVLDASDVVLHEPSGSASGALVSALASDFEARLADVYAKARSVEELREGLGGLGEEMHSAREAFESTHARTSGLIESRFDETVRAAFREIADELPGGLEDLDKDLLKVTSAYLLAQGIPFRSFEQAEAQRLQIEPSAELPEDYRQGVLLRIGVAAPDAKDDAEPLHLGHRLIRAAVEEARGATSGRLSVAIERPKDAALHGIAKGMRGRLVVLRVHYGGFEPCVELLPIVVFAGDDAPTWGAEALPLVLSSMVDQMVDQSTPVLPDAKLEAALLDAVDEARFVVDAHTREREGAAFEAAVERLERAVEDRILVHCRQRIEVREHHKIAVARRDAAVGASARTRAERECTRLEAELDAVDCEIDRLRRRDDENYETWRLKAFARRYAQPTSEMIIDADFVIA